MAIDVEILARIRGTISGAADVGTASVPVTESATNSLSDGTGANQATHVYVDAFSIAASGNMTIDLAGSLTDALGDAMVFTAIKAILIEADSANTNNIVYGNGTNPFVGPQSAGTETITLKPGGIMLLTNPTAAGWAVGAGASDVINLANSAAGSAVTGRITIVGEAP